MGKYIIRQLEESAKKYQQAQEEALFKILHDNRETAYGKKYNFSNIRSIEEYKQNVPITKYNDYAAYIDRMLYNNEQDLITAYPVKYYMLSSGTTGDAKYIPMTEQAIINYALYSYRCAYDMVETHYEKEKNDMNFEDCSHLLHSCDALNTVNHVTFGEDLAQKIFLINEIRYHKLQNGVDCGIVSSAMFKWMHEKGIMDFNRYTSPEMVLFPTEFMDLLYLKLRFALVCEDVTSIEGVYVHQILSLMKYLEDHWEIFVDDIEKGTIHPDIEISAEKRIELQKYLKPEPERARQLREEFEKGFDTPIVPRIWKNIHFIMAISGETFSKYMEKLRKYIGTIPYHCFIYAASEGIFGTALGLNRFDEYVLVPSVGLYEFLPLDADEEGGNIKTYTQEDIQVGEKYELIYTGVSGFYRYRMGDVIEIKGFYHDAPVVKYCYRRKQTVNVAGEKMDMGSIASVVGDFEETYELIGNDFCIYPDEDRIPARYVVLLDVENEQKPNIPQDELNCAMDALLRRINADYDDCRNLKEIAMPEVYFLRRGAFERYKEHLHNSGKEVGQHKPVRIIDTEEKREFFFSEIK